MMWFSALTGGDDRDGNSASQATCSVVVNAAEGY